jgi:uncharacterized membrane protein YbhN (UPF0104 family)
MLPRMDAGAQAPAAADEVAAPEKRRRSPIWRIVSIVVAVALIGFIFVGIIPKIATYGEVWDALKQMTWIEVATLVLITAFNIFTYWPQMTAALPGLSIPQAAVVNQSTTAVANTVPAGGVVAVGLTFTMLRSWGFHDSATALMVSTTGIWNIFFKLAMPLLALILLLVTGDYSQRYLIPTVIGLVVLGALVLAGALMLWKDSFARGIGGAAGKVASAILKLFRKPAVHWGEAGLRFRNQTIALIRDRWFPLTWTTLLSQVALYFVLLTSLRHVGVSEQEVSAVQIFAVYSFVRLLSAIPLTPGGVGFVELGYVGALIAASQNLDVPKDVFEAQVTAAVLVFRTLTYGVQIPLGAATYLYWLRSKRWRKPISGDPAPAGAAAGLATA